MFGDGQRERELSALTSRELARSLEDLSPSCSMRRRAEFVVPLRIDVLAVAQVFADAEARVHRRVLSDKSHALSFGLGQGRRGASKIRTFPRSVRARPRRC